MYRVGPNYKSKKIIPCKGIMFAKEKAHVRVSNIPRENVLKQCTRIINEILNMIV